ncbi:MAG: hypothetical protein GX931_06370 [Acholeplasmataceae bacterium]|nr:hypothetical protein [Acholeplasmataceae bacterium]
MTEEPYQNIIMPSITDIMIDKLTAFAPRTIGIKFYKERKDGVKKEHTREVAKQWFDINEIFKKCNNFDNLKERYIKLSKFEINQRGLNNVTYNDCLKDSFECALEYLRGGSYDKELNENLKKGIKKLDSFVNVSIDSNYFVEAAVNTIELISRIFCDDSIEYDKLVKKSQKNMPYSEFIKENDLKLSVQKVRFNNKDDRERFIKSIRVINEYI